MKPACVERPRPATAVGFLLVLLTVLLLPSASPALGEPPRGEEASDTERTAAAVECGLVEPDFKAPLRVFSPDHYRAGKPACLAERMAFYKVPGVTMAVIDGNEVSWAKAYGVLEAGGERPVTTASVFEAASATKILTTVVALRLAEQGVVGLDRDVNTYLASWKVPALPPGATQPVTLRLLLSHQAGINRPAKGLPFDAERPPTLAQVLSGTPPALNQGVAVERAPGSSHQYSNLGFLVVQAVLEGATGKPFRELANEQVFRPLGLESSTLDHPLSPEWRKRWGVPHDDSGTPRPRTQLPGAVAHGGLVATPSDLARLAIEIGLASQGRSNRLLSRRSAETMLARATDIDARQLGAPIGQGLGVMLLGADRTLHFLHPGGNDPGANCWVIASPATGQGAVIMTNGAGGEGLMLELLASIAHRYRWPDLSRGVPPSAASHLETSIDGEGLAAAGRLMERMLASPDDYAFSEAAINELGYRYLQRGALNEAVAVFDFNVRRFPKADNAYDSLAEAQLASGDLAGAGATLKAWLAKSPENAAVARRVAGFPAFAKRTQDERRNAYRPGQPTGATGPYLGQTPPGKAPQLFAPGLVSLASTSEYACSMSPGGDELYFTRAGSPQVIMVSRLGEGGWTFPEPVTFSAGFSAHEPHVTYDGTRVYWGWFRSPPPDAARGTVGPNPSYGIFVSERAAGGWSLARYAGSGMYVSSTRDGRLFLTDHGTDGDFLAEVKLAEGRFASRERLRGGIEALLPVVTRTVAHPTLAPDGSYVVFDIAGGSHLFVSFRQEDGTWGEAIDLAKHGLPPEAGIATVSKDGKYLFYGLDGDIYWVSTALIEDLRPAAQRR